MRVWPHIHRALADELQSLPVGDAGLQPELLADAVLPRGAGQDRGPETYHPGDCATAVSISGGATPAL